MVVLENENEGFLLFFLLKTVEFDTTALSILVLICKKAISVIANYAESNITLSII